MGFCTKRDNADLESGKSKKITNHRIENKKCEYNYLIVLSSCMALAMISISIYVGITESFHSYDSYECNITRVEHPLELPNENSTENWIKCDCGKRCWSWHPCITLYASIVKEDNSDIHKVIETKTSMKQCTFGSKHCSNGENVITVQKYLADSIVEANSYKNTTVDCYWNGKDEYVYLSDNNTMYYITLASCILIALCCLCCCGCAITEKRKL